MRLITFSECNSLVEAAIACGLAEPDQRALLIPTKTVLSALPTLRRPRSQLVADLDELALTTWPTDEHPLMVWLHRAQLQASGRPEATLFARFEAEVGRRLAGPWGTRSDPSWGPPPGPIVPIRLTAPIADHRPRITIEEVRDAVRPASPPLGDGGLVVDFCAAGHTSLPPSARAAQIHRDVQGFLRYADAERRLGLFGFAPIPLLMAFGSAISDKRAALVFERHRHTDDWRWGTVVPPAAGLTGQAKWLPAPSGDVALLISISDKVKRDAALEAVGGPCDVYEIEADQPRVNLIRSPSQLTEFSEAWRRALDAVHARVGHSGRVHVFPATPLSVSVEMGRRLLPKADPPLTVYDYRHGRFEVALGLGQAFQ